MKCADERTTTPLRYTLRPATERDYAWLWEVKRLTMRPYVEQTWGGWDNEAQEEFFRQNFVPAHMRVIVIDGRDAGLFHVEREAAEIFLANIQLLPEFQNRGIGTALVRDLIAEAQAAGKSVRLQVLKPNRAARRLYERLGFALFEETGIHYRMRAVPPDVYLRS
jgi:ribosomal protein S18 acetylase RimI-like enzyme